MPIIRNGAKGISLLIVYLPFCINNINNPSIAPNQKAIIRAVTTAEPSNNPMPKPNLASPKPIHRPEDTSHRRAKKAKVRGPAKVSKEYRLNIPKTL